MSKYNQRNQKVGTQYNAAGNVILENGTEVEEKNGCLFVIERVTIFFFSLFVGSIVSTVFLGGIAGAAVFFLSGSSDLAVIVAIGVGLLAGLGVALSNTSNVSRFRQSNHS